MNAKVRLSSRVAVILFLLFCIPAWPGAAFATDVGRGFSPANAGQSVPAPDLDRALRGGDLEKARRLVPEDWAAAEQLFVSYLERAFVSPDAARGRPDARTLAGRLAEVFFRIVEYDFARAVVSTLDTADPGKRKQLIAVVRDCFSTLERLRASYAPSESRTSVQTAIRTQLSEIADRFRALSFLRGELFALKSAVNLGGLEPRAAQVADELGDDLSRVRKTPYTEASLAMARRLGLPRLEVSILTYLGSTVSGANATTDNLEQAAKYYEQARALARTLPALETLNAWHYRAAAPQAATIYHPRLWTVYHRLQRPVLARALVAEAVEISRPFGETAVLATLSQFARDAVGFGSDAVEAVLQASLAYSAKAELATMRTLSRSGSTFRLDLAEKALALAVAIPDPRERAVTLEWYSVGRLIRYKAAWASANFRPEEHAVLPAPYHQLLELCLDSNEIDLTAEALANQAEMQSGSGEPELATKTYQRAIELAERAGNWLKAAQVANRACDFPRFPGVSDKVRYEFATRAVEAAKRANSSLELAKGLRVSARTEEEMQQAVAAAVRHTELTGDREQEVQSLDRLAAMHLTSGDYQAAIDTSLRLAERSRGMRPPFDQRERAAYETIARTYSAIGEPLLARAAADRVRALLETTITEANRRAAAPDLWRTYEQLGRMAADRGEPAAAMEYWDTALKKIAEAAPTNSAQLARRSILQERATLYAQLGDFEASLQDWDDVLPLLAPTLRNYSMSEASQKATWTAAVAWTHALAGNYDKALALARDAIAELKRHTSGQWAQQLFAGQSADDRILEILLLTGHSDEAVAFCNFLYEKHRQERASSDFWTAVNERDLLVDLARSHLKAGQLERARSLLASAVDISRTLPAADPGWAGLGGWPELALGTLELGAANYADAKRHLAAARAAVNPYDADRIWQIERALGLALARTGDEAGAETHYEHALTALESIRERPRPEESQLRYGFDRSRVYEEYAGLLAAKAASSGRQVDAEAAFQAVERKRAQTLWGLLATGWSRMAPEALPDQVRRSLELEVRLAAKQGILRGEFDQPPDKRNGILIEKLRADVKQLQDDHGRLLASIAQGQYRYAAPTRLAASLAAPVQAALDPSRVLLEYLVTDERSYAFVVSRAGVKVVPLAIGRESLRQQVQHLLAPFRQLRAGEVDLTRLTYDTRAAHALYRAIFAPIRSALGSAFDILIVPDDVLHVVPFEALVERMPQAMPQNRVLHARFAGEAFLVRRYAISYLTSSAQLLSVAPSAAADQAPKGLFAMANPAAGRVAPAPTEDDPLKRQLRSARFDAFFAPIPGTEVEAMRIAQHFGKGTATVITGAQATEAAYKSQAGQHAIVHFATHGVAWDGQPLYSTMILAPDKMGGDDGFLQAYEVLRTPLRAELVVLSGCETALGTEDWGQGLVGLVAAFEQAGAKTVLATLWSIDESATDVMAAFYRAMADGKSTPEALRQAKLELLRQRVRLGKVEVSLAHPFFWAPFRLVGVPGSLPAGLVGPARKAPGM